VLYLLTRLMPEARRRTKAARQTFAERRWRAEIDAWNSTGRAAREAANLTLQDVDLGGLDDAGLAAHVGAAAENLRTGLTEHFDLIGSYLPVGDLVAACEGWGIPAADVLALLAGSSPGTTQARAAQSRVAAALAAAGPSRPTSLADIRAASAEAAAALDAYLRRFGWWMVTVTDVDGRTLGELPEVVLRSIVESTVSVTAQPDPSAIRERVPTGERTRFDDLLTEARYAYPCREDNVGLCGAWPGGLLRRALLEAGRRLLAADRLLDPAHVFELQIAETTGLRAGTASLDAAEVAARAHLRAAADAMSPPPVLGPEPGGPPPFDVFPAPMQRTVTAVDAMRRAMTERTDDVPLSGTGIGTSSYRGRARVAVDAEDALTRMTPGDVLVTAVTTPAFNVVLPLAGALVTQFGGPLSHPAIAAREHGIPAVIGATDAIDRIPDGATVLVDPVLGTVEVIS
jgi:pyruvate,water dikinase